ncbi:MAG: hypothetical protein NC489_25520 [Ruminococcus flavefaciens]|nr:hypothetical protein [Ruminococcus flavefaciens]
MFERFGEFDSAEEINAKAAELLAAGDTEGIRALARENGLETEDAEAYIAGGETCLTYPLPAADGKLLVESRELQLEGRLGDWKNMVLSLCAEDRQVCDGVRKKGKSLCGCISAMISRAFETKTQVSDRIVRATKVKHNGEMKPLRGPLYLDGLTNAGAKQVIREYYTS